MNPPISTQSRLVSFMFMVINIINTINIININNINISNIIYIEMH